MKTTKIFLPFVALALTFGLAACGSSQNGGNNASSGQQSTSQPAKPKINITAPDNKTSVELEAEQTVQLTSDVPDVTWSSADNNVATVDASGKVTAVAAGETNILAKKEGYQDGKIAIKVKRAGLLATLHFEDADHFAADGWWGDDENGATPEYDRAGSNASDEKCIAHFGTGDKETLTFTSSAAINAELVMTMASSSSDVDLASCMSIKLNNADVALTGKTLEGGSSSDFQEVSLGTLALATSNVLEISFTSSSAPYLDDLAVYSKQQATIAAVKPAAKETIEVASASLTINRGGTAQINVTKPTDKTGVTYTSSNAEIATVSATGLVTSLALGDINVIVAKAGMLSARVAVKVTDDPVPGEIRIEAEDQPEGFDFEALGFHMYPDGSYIRFGHSGGAYITGYDVTDEVELAYTVTSPKAQDMRLVILAAPHYNMQAGDIFSFKTDATLKLNNQNLTVDEAATVLGDGAAMGAKTQNVIIGNVHLNQGDNPFVIQFHGKAPALDCFKFLPLA